MCGGELRISLSITSITAMTAGQFELICLHVNIADRIDAPAKCEFRCVSRLFFKQKVRLWKTINAAVTCQTLRQLQRAILTSGVLQIHENARPHNVVVTQQLLEQFKWE
ncbi:hypothetical protein AVEN_147402-1 [Araneus ventricosus]|uniref:Histone-lysine N-methyltransferase SETMAR n=1 Tax=Araneus ventricosus TaxID=182803 RepID=A0A4Y2DN96_ARAVE|nr:hypothetical protein AVEN_147402-1 [Araneus ventricosus]